jgi:sugar/nucleoside kinase (ribokinase family)
MPETATTIQGFLRRVMFFTGAFAYGLANQMGLKESLRLATIAAGLSVQEPGGRLSIPTLELVNAEVSR